MTALLLSLLLSPAAAQEIVLTPEAGTAAQLPPVAVLWVPREDALDWDAVVRFAQAHPTFGMTIAVSPATFVEISTETLAALPPPVEFAMRLPGDPVLPLIKDMQNPALALAASDLPAIARPQDVLTRLTGLSAQYQNAIKPPAGLVLAGGALTRELLPVVSGTAWVAVGLAEGATVQVPIRDAGGTTFVPFRLNKREFAEGGLRAPAAIVVDDTLDFALIQQPTRALYELTVSTLGAGARFTSVSDYLADPRVAAATELPAQFKPWSGDYAAWTGQRRQRAAWRLLAQVAQFLDTLQNANTLPPRALEAAAGQLAAAEAGLYFVNLDSRLPASIREQSEREFRASLSNVYRIAGQPVPDELQRPLPEDAAAGPTGAAGAMELGADSLVFNDPSGENGVPHPLPEELTPRVARGLTALERFSVNWTSDAVTFSVNVSSVAEAPKAPHGFGHLLFDVYIDLNNRTGAGATALLPGREALAESKDAWEYALTVSGHGGKLYRSGPDGKPALLQDLEPSRTNGTVSVSVPTSVLRGNPQNWGYLVTLMMLDAKSADAEFPQPLKDQSGNPLLDVLAPWQNDPPTPAQRRRLEAVRAQ